MGACVGSEENSPQQAAGAVTATTTTTAPGGGAAASSAAPAAVELFDVPQVAQPWIAATLDHFSRSLAAAAEAAASSSSEGQQRQRTENGPRIRAALAYIQSRGEIFESCFTVACRRARQVFAAAAPPRGGDAISFEEREQQLAKQIDDAADFLLVRTGVLRWFYQGCELSAETGQMTQTPNPAAGAIREWYRECAFNVINRLEHAIAPLPVDGVLEHSVWWTGAEATARQLAVAEGDGGNSTSAGPDPLDSFSIDFASVDDDILPPPGEEASVDGVPRTQLVNVIVHFKNMFAPESPFSAAHIEQVRASLRERAAEIRRMRDEQGLVPLWMFCYSWLCAPQLRCFSELFPPHFAESRQLFEMPFENVTNDESVGVGASLLRAAAESGGDENGAAGHEEDDAADADRSRFFATSPAPSLAPFGPASAAVYRAAFRSAGNCKPELGLSIAHTGQFFRADNTLRKDAIQQFERSLRFPIKTYACVIPVSEFLEAY